MPQTSLIHSPSKDTQCDFFVVVQGSSYMKGVCLQEMGEALGTDLQQTNKEN